MSSRIGRKHLIIPDAHSMPGEDLRRFDWLGELILEEMPDVIVDIGDWWDMPSLCSYDKGTKSFEGRRYKDDIAAGHEADRRAFGPIVKYNGLRTKHKKRKYEPLLVRTKGNHENRVLRAVEKQPELDGVISMSDFDTRLDLPNVQDVSFLKPIVVDGVAYCHYFVSGVMGRPIGSANVMLAKNFMSSTAGHQHTRDWAEGVRIDGVRMQALICGAFHDIDHTSTYANSQSEGLWWNGLHIKNNVYDGNYDRTEISIEALQRRMGCSNSTKVTGENSDAE